MPPTSARPVRTARAADRERAARVIDLLAASMPGARIELDFQDDLQLLVSVILSAQSTDKRVNLISPPLFRRFPDAAAYACAEPEDLWPFIRTVGLYRAKAKAIVGAMRAILRDHDGRVPRDRVALEKLPGVGQKSAGVMLIQLGVEPAFPVDTHVGRLARRLGFTRERDPARVEARMRTLLPPERWADAHQLLVWHGRRTCLAARPACERCVVKELCPKVGVGRRRATHRRKRPRAPTSPPAPPSRPRPRARS